MVDENDGVINGGVEEVDLDEVAPQYEVDLEREEFRELVGKLRRNVVLKYIIPPAGKKRWPYMHFRHIAIYGAPESGKTTAALTFARYAEWYAEEAGLSFAAVRALTLKSCLDALGVARERGDVKLEEPVYLYLLVDDAEASNPSLRTKKSWNVVKIHNNIRHFLEHMGLKRGLVVVVYSTQRFFDLERVARLSNVTVFKSIQVNDPSEEKFYRDFLGAEAFSLLKNITYRIYSMYDDRAKSVYVARELTGRVVADRLPGIARPRRLVDAWDLDMLVEEEAAASAGAVRTGLNPDVLAVDEAMRKAVEESRRRRKPIRVSVSKLVERWLRETVEVGEKFTPGDLEEFLRQLVEQGVRANPGLVHVYIEMLKRKGLVENVERGVWRRIK